MIPHPLRDDDAAAPYECVGGPADGEVVYLTPMHNSTQRVRGHMYTVEFRKSAHERKLYHVGKEAP